MKTKLWKQFIYKIFRMLMKVKRNINYVKLKTVSKLCFNFYFILYLSVSTDPNRDGMLVCIPHWGRFEVLRGLKHKIQGYKGKSIYLLFLKTAEISAERRLLYMWSLWKLSCWKKA